MVRKNILFQNTKLSYLDNEKQNKPALIFCHANGYSTEIFNYYYRKLDRQFRTIGIDFLNHGRSEGNLNFSGWHFYRDQILAVIDELGLSNVIGIGHSMGGAALIQAGYKRVEPFALLIGLDPTILNFIKIEYSRTFLNPLAKTARERKYLFKSKKLLKRIFEKHPLTRNWHPEILADYLNSCFKQIFSSSGDLVLCCSPAAEAKNFCAPEYKTVLQAYRLRVPFHYIVADNSEVLSKGMIRKIAQKNKNTIFYPKETIDEGRPNLTHHFPFEEPEWTLKLIKNIIQIQSGLKTWQYP